MPQQCVTETASICEQFLVSYHVTTHLRISSRWFFLPLLLRRVDHNWGSAVGGEGRVYNKHLYTITRFEPRTNNYKTYQPLCVSVSLLRVRMCITEELV